MDLGILNYYDKIPINPIFYIPKGDYRGRGTVWEVVDVRAF